MHVLLCELCDFDILRSLSWSKSMGPWKIPIQTIVISSKLGKPKDDGANLGVPLGISRNIRMISRVFSILQGGFGGKVYQCNFTFIVKKGGLNFFWSRNNDIFRNIFIILNVCISHFLVSNTKKSLTYVIFR